MIMRPFGVTYPVDETQIVQSDEWILNVRLYTLYSIDNYYVLSINV